MSSLYALVAFSLLAFACSSASSATVKPLCKAGESSYCRCKDRAEGSKVCHADGEGFDACLPCETASNPEDTSGTTYPPYDSGAPSTCGNGSVEDGEECDDGNAVADDGCSSACRLEGADALSSRSCPGMPIHVGASTVEFLTTTVGAPNTTSVKRPCDGSTTTGSAAADRIFAVVAQKTGAMTVTTTEQLPLPPEPVKVPV